MTYTSTNTLSDFEFHDSILSFVYFENNCLTMECECLNIHKDSEQNPFTTDMEIEKAIICFENFDIISYEVGRWWKVDENGNQYTDEPQIILYNDEALGRLLAQLKNETTVFDFDIKEDNVYFIDGLSLDPFFTVCFTFENIKISWDEFKKEAWYVECR